MSDRFQALLADDHPHLFDGAMGTELYARGIYINKCYDELSVTDPDLLRSVHEDYVRAGAELLGSELKKAGLETSVLQGDMPQTLRKRALDGFRQGHFTGFGRGIVAIKMTPVLHFHSFRLGSRLGQFGKKEASISCHAATAC